MKLGDVLQDLRRIRGFTTRLIADELGITQFELQQIEDNIIPVEEKLLEKFATILNVPIDYIRLLTLTTSNIVPEKQEAYEALMPKVKELINAYLFPESSGEKSQEQA